MTVARADSVAVIRKRVARGAALLDLKKPSWAWAVRLGNLDMEQGDRCIVGQNYRGDYFRGAGDLGLPSTRAQISHGFLASMPAQEDPETMSLTYERLDAVWAEEVRARRRRKS